MYSYTVKPIYSNLLNCVKWHERDLTLLQMQIFQVLSSVDKNANDQLQYHDMFYV